MKTDVSLLVLLLWGLSAAQDDGQKLNEVSIKISLQPDRIEAMEETLKTIMKKLKTIQTKETVIFTACLRGRAHEGPFKAAKILVYNDVITNIGKAYNSYTGIFTAPVPGVYFFTFAYDAGGFVPVRISLMKNGNLLVASFDHKSSDPGDNGGNSVTVELVKGDKVYVSLAKSTHVWAGKDRHTTFTGFLLG